MKKDFRYILKPKLEILLTNNPKPAFYRPQTSRQPTTLQKYGYGEQSPKQVQNNWQLNIISLNKFDPNNTIFSKSTKTGTMKKYKDDFFTRTLNKCVEKDDRFLTQYSQDFERSYKYVKPAQSFFQNRFQRRPDSQCSQRSNRDARLCGRRYSKNKVKGPTESYKNMIFQPVCYSSEEQFNTIDKPLCNLTEYYSKPQIQYRHPKRIRKHRQTMSMKREKTSSKKVFKPRMKKPKRVGVLQNQNAVKLPKRSCSLQNPIYIKLNELNLNSRCRDKNPQEDSPVLKRKKKVSIVKSATVKQKSRKMFCQKDCKVDEEGVHMHDYQNDQIQNNPEFTEEQMKINQIRDKIGNQIQNNPLFNLTTRNSPWNCMKLKYNNIQTNYGKEFKNKSKRNIPQPQHFRTEKVYQHKTQVGYDCQKESMYGKNFKPKNMKTESMQWKQSRFPQKFHNQSHYNENYPNHKRAYSKVDHFKIPYLPTYQPSPLHVINQKEASNYQNQFFDKSPRKCKFADDAQPQEDEIYCQPVKAPQNEQRYKQKENRKNATNRYHNHRKVKKKTPSVRGRDKKPKDTIQLDTGADYMKGGSHHQRKYKAIKIIGSQRAFSRGMPDLNYVPIPSYNGQFGTQTKRIYGWKKTKRRKKKSQKKSSRY